MKSFFMVKHLTSARPRSSHPGHALAVHCDGGFLEVHIDSGDRGRCTLAADPDVHDHSEPQLGGLVAQRRHFKCPLSSYCSRHAIKGGDVAHLADAAVAPFDVATSDAVSYTTNLPISTGKLLTLHQPRGLAHTLGLTGFVHRCLTHLQTYIVYNVKIFYLTGWI